MQVDISSAVGQLSRSLSKPVELDMMHCEVPEWHPIGANMRLPSAGPMKGNLSRVKEKSSTLMFAVCGLSRSRRIAVMCGMQFESERPFDGDEVAGGVITRRVWTRVDKGRCYFQTSNKLGPAL
eukprot:2785359-Amphidinium_carterae.1